MTTLTLKPPSKPPRAAASYLLHELTENASSRPQHNVARQAWGLSGAPGRMQRQDVIEYMQDRKAFKSLLNLQTIPIESSKQTAVQMAAFSPLDLHVESVTCTKQWRITIVYTKALSNSQI